MIEIAYNDFLRSFDYNYPVDFSPYHSYRVWEERLLEFKSEVNSNLMELPPDSRTFYLNKLQDKLTSLLKYVYLDENVFKKQLKRFDTEIESIKELILPEDSILYKIIRHKPASDDGPDPDDIHPLGQQIQYSIYQYHYNKTIREALEYLNNRQTVVKQLNNPPLRMVNMQQGKPLLRSFEYRHYAKTPNKLNVLLKELVRLKLVTEDTKVSVFKKLFSGQEVTNKVEWVDDHSKLAYLIKHLYMQGTLMGKPHQKWKLTLICFEMQNGLDLTNDRLRLAKRPANYLEIEKAAKLLK